MEFIHFDEKQIEEIPGHVRDSHKEIILGIVKLPGMLGPLGFQECHTLYKVVRCHQWNIKPGKNK